MDMCLALLVKYILVRLWVVVYSADLACRVRSPCSSRDPLMAVFSSRSRTQIFSFLRRPRTRWKLKKPTLGGRDREVADRNVL